MSLFTFLTDTFSGTLATNLSAHTADSSNTWALTGGSGIFLNGIGGVYTNNSSSCFYRASGANLPFNQTYTFTANLTCLSANDYMGIAFTDAGGNLYVLRCQPTGTGFNLVKVPSGLASSTQLVGVTYSQIVGHTYNLSLAMTTDGLSTTLTYSVYDQTASSSVWSGTYADTYKANQSSQITGNGVGYGLGITNQPYIPIGVGLYGFTGSGGSSTVGAQISALSVTSPAFATQPTAYLALGSTGNVLTLTGNGTNWPTSGANPFSVSAGTITAYSLSTATSATITVTAPSTGTGFTVSSSTDTATCNVPVLIPPTDPGYYFTILNWYMGSGYALSNNAGAYFYLQFTGTSVKLYFNTANSGTSHEWVRVLVDSSYYQDFNLSVSSTIQITPYTLSAGAHTLKVIYRSRSTNVDGWNTPLDQITFLGATISAGGSTSAPTTKPNTLLFYGDSRFEGFYTIAQGSGFPGDNSDATCTIGFMLGEALNAEVSLIAFSGQGYTVGGNTNVPPLFTPGNDTLSSWDKYYAGQPRLTNGLFNQQPTYIVLPFGSNDWYFGTTQNGMQNSVSGLLTVLRAAAPHTQILLQDGSLEGYFTSQTNAYLYASQPWIANGFNTYQAATRDAYCRMFYNGYTTEEVKDFYVGQPNWATITQSSRLCFSFPHMSAHGHQVLGCRFISAIQKLIDVKNPFRQQ